MTNAFRSNLSCMFTADGFNYDWIEANQVSSHTFPSLELASSGFESLPNSYKAALKEQAFQSLYRVMTPSKADIALAAKGERERFSLDCIDAMQTSNRPDAIPSDLRIVRVTGWEAEKRVFIPLPAGKGAKLSDLVKANTKPDGFMMNVPMRPIGQALGEVDATAWRKGEASSIRVHAPRPLPAYQHPQRELTQGEQLAMVWLANPERIKKPATRSSRMARMAAKFWDKGDGHQGLQPVMAENASQRALGRINRAIRFNAVAAQ